MIYRVIFIKITPKSQMVHSNPKKCGDFGVLIGFESIKISINETIQKLAKVGQLMLIMMF